MSRGISWTVDATRPSVERKDTMYYEAVSQCTRMLRNIGTWLDKAEKHAAAKTFDVNILMTDRLAPDMKPGGESGIRTHGTVSRTHAFQACALSHSAISPDPLS